MHICLIFGPPGAGKGTYSEELVKKVKINHLSTGNMLREISSSNTEFGNKVKETMNAGKLLDDNDMKCLLENYIDMHPGLDHVLLDGYPRTSVQCEDLVKVLEAKNIEKPLRVILLEAPEQLCRERITGRWVSPDGLVYNVHSRKPLSLIEAGESAEPKPENMLCDKTKQQLYIRKDDLPEIFETRWSTWLDQSKNCFDFMKDNSNFEMLKFDGTANIETNLEQMIEFIRK